MSKELAGARIQIRRTDDRLRLHAGDRDGQRPSGRLLPSRTFDRPPRKITGDLRLRSGNRPSSAWCPSSPRASRPASRRGRTKAPSDPCASDISASPSCACPFSSCPPLPARAAALLWPTRSRSTRTTFLRSKRVARLPSCFSSAFAAVRCIGGAGRYPFYREIWRRGAGRVAWLSWP